MKTTATTLDRIADAAVEQLRHGGAANLTVGSVAKAAGISTALVHYHFESKGRLLRAAAERIAALRAERRTAPLALAGLDAVDALRAVIEEDAADGAERAWQDILVLAREDAEIRRVVTAARAREHVSLAARLPALLASLGAPGVADGEQLAALMAACLDGLALARASGMAEDAFRSAYDAFWLVLIAGNAPRARR